MSDLQSKYSHPKYSCDVGYFNKIDTKDKAYILGFLWADGNISRSSGLQICIQEQDIEILTFIREQLKTNIPIKYHRVKNKSYAKLSINRKPIIDALISHGMIFNKSQNNLVFPNIAK